MVVLQPIRFSTPFCRASVLLVTDQFLCAILRKTIVQLRNIPCHSHFLWARGSLRAMRKRIQAFCIWPGVQLVGSRARPREATFSTRVCWRHRAKVQLLPSPNITGATGLGVCSSLLHLRYLRTAGRVTSGSHKFPWQCQECELLHLFFQLDSCTNCCKRVKKK